MTDTHRVMNLKTISVGAFEVNCYVAWKDELRQALVVDPGSDADVILNELNRNRLEVAAYLITHGHADHVSALAKVHGARPAPIAMHPEDRRWAFSEANQIPPIYPQPDMPSQIERELQDGQEWTDAGLTYRVITTPGHTPGGVCFYFPDEKIVFTGDTLFLGSVGRTDLPGGSARTLTDSLTKLVRLPPETQVLAGHGPASTIGIEARTNFFLSSAVRRS